MKPPSERHYKAALRAFRELLDKGAHAAAMHEGHPLFECPLCGPPSEAELVIDGTISNQIHMTCTAHPLG